MIKKKINARIPSPLIPRTNARLEISLEEDESKTDRIPL